MSFKEITFPAAWTPLSVRAQRTRDDYNGKFFFCIEFESEYRYTFFGSLELALDIAPALTKASNMSLSIVLCGGFNCIPLYPVPQYPIRTATFRLGFLSSFSSPNSSTLFSSVPCP